MCYFQRPEFEFHFNTHILWHNTYVTELHAPSLHLQIVQKFEKSAIAVDNGSGTDSQEVAPGRLSLSHCLSLDFSPVRRKSPVETGADLGDLQLLEALSYHASLDQLHRTCI
jgi:hypothetical protein